MQSGIPKNRTTIAKMFLFAQQLSFIQQTYTDESFYCSRKLIKKFVTNIISKIGWLSDSRKLVCGFVLESLHATSCKAKILCLTADTHCKCAPTRAKLRIILINFCKIESPFNQSNSQYNSNYYYYRLSKFYLKCVI